MKSENTIRHYRNTIVLEFNTHSDDADHKKWHHYNKWMATIKFLQKRGFKVTENAYYRKQYSCLSKYHKIGHKKDVALLMEISGHMLTIEFGNIQNLWADMPQSFWNNPTDDRYTQLSYLENKAVELEIKRLKEFWSKYNHTWIIDDSKLPPEEYIVHQLKRNTHIHPNVSCLDDIKADMTPDSYDYKYNSTDKNKKQIICGDLKYFYSWRTSRLCCGHVWHHINNMWWVISGGELHNMSSSSLFDFDPSLPKRKVLSYDKQIQRLHTELKQAEQKQNYERCIVLRELLKPQTLYNVWSIKHGAWWGANNGGYTNQKNNAGVYTEKNILANQSYYNNGESTKSIKITN